MCMICDMFPPAEYTNGTYFLRRAQDTRAQVMAECLESWAVELAKNPSAQNFYNYLEAHRLADDAYFQATGEHLPSC